MMKIPSTILSVLAFIILVGCESQITNPMIGSDDHQLTLSKAGDVAEFAATVPTGTFYKLPSNPDSSISASGGEVLPSGTWVGNTNSHSYTIHVYSSTLVQWDNLSVVSIDYPVNTEYLNSSENWVSILSSSTVSAKAIRTGNDGSCSLSNDEEEELIILPN